MAETFGSGMEGVKKFESPEEELAFLRAQVAQKEREALELRREVPRERTVAETVERYKVQKPEDVLAAKHIMEADAIERKVLHLSSEEEKKIDELVAILEKNGVRNALSVVAKMKSPHLEDDFHRFLVQYIAEGIPMPDLKPDTPLERALHMRLFEVTLPEAEIGDRPFRELVAAMEQFYEGMLSVAGGRTSPDARNHFSMELALSDASDETIFYVAVPDARIDLFEKHILGAFPNARVREHREDYNPFVEGGASVGAVAGSASLPLFPLRTFEEFENDPLNIIVSAFSKIKKEGEAAVIQILVAPNPVLADRFKSAIGFVKKGMEPKKALKEASATIMTEVFGAAKEMFFSSSKKPDEEKKEIPAEERELVLKKGEYPIFDCNIRVLASAATPARAEEIARDIQSAFHQFGSPQGNSVAWKVVPQGELAPFFHNISFRLFSEKESFPLNARELTTVFHFPVSRVASPHLKQARSITAAPPPRLPAQGVVLGVNRHRGVATDIRLSPEDRLRHLYVIGQTGTGKTTLLKNMIVQDIMNGDGVCLIDPHGTDIADVLSVIPAERKDDVIYFDPGAVDRPMGLNMLEYDRRFPEQKTFVVNEMLSIFNKLFDMKTAGGPMFEQYFRNAVLLVLEDPDTGTTLLEVARVLADDDFRRLKLLRCKNPMIVQFWREQAEKAKGDASLGNIVPYITSKFDVFMTNDIMRPIIGQETSAFNFRSIMDEKKILLVNLSKGRLGDINAHLIGLVIVGKILMAALSRVDSAPGSLPPFYLYIDEFQNVTTDSIATILSEARKYRLGLIIAHQFIAQIPQEIRDAVFGNVGSLAVFRVGAEDAEFLKQQFDPIFTARDIMNIENRNAYAKMLVGGTPAAPFNFETQAPAQGAPQVAEYYKELSKQKYGKPRAEVEDMIMQKYQKMVSPQKNT